MNLPQSSQLNISQFSRIFDNKSESYKLFWFKAIMNKVSADKQELAFDELIDEMVCEAWYMVTEYHLNLGPSDTLEALVGRVSEISGIKSSEKRNVIEAYLSSCSDKEVGRMKQVLTLNVPYRLQAPLLTLHGSDWNIGKSKLAEVINHENDLIYYFTDIASMKTKIRIQDKWMKYLSDNQEIIMGWIEYNMIIYLQKRNPNVPGIAEKLSAPRQRQMEKVKKYWKLIASQKELRDIYSGEILRDKDISIDHFIPWSYVAHDELWNLHPTTKSINSSKSNNLPDWDEYFNKLSETEFMAYELVWKHDKIHDAFNKCLMEHVNSDDVRYKLYREGLDDKEFSRNLKSIILPVYQSAGNLGFRQWRYECR